MISAFLTLGLLPAFGAVELSVAITFEGYAVLDVARGAGKPVERGDVVTVEFAVRDAKGKELASTGHRGLPYTFAVYPGNEPFLAPPLLGMRPGGVRIVKMPRGTYPTSTVAGVALFGMDLDLELRLVSVRPKPER